MKKPNITPGEWKHKKSVACVYSQEHMIADCYNSILIPEERLNANAKAISAVPEMIDALIEAHKFLVVTPANMRNNRGERPIEAFNKIEIALKKAGVT